ncbi:MAG: CDP-alcohol phosphatidyltransferase family protein [Rubricoccaceae bacterium]|nr:CDP-alcohol phosphatidyltransferase family protein [Rubricoccaceae bacterium]
MAPESTQVKRTQEIEEITNLYFIHPISRALVTVFHKMGLHPNAVSIGGIVFGILAAWAYSQFQQWEMALAGFLFMVGWHIMDGADGQLARLSGKTSEFGKVLDGLVDHLSFALVYVSLTVASAAIFGGWVWWLAVAAGVSHLVQASTYEFQRQSYDYWVFGKDASRPVMPDEFRESMNGQSGLKRFFAQLQLAYLNMQYRMAGVNLELMASLSSLKSEGQASEMAEAYRAANLKAVKTWSILCSNYRTLAIFVACLAKNPLYFFLFEAGLLNVALVGLRMMQARRNKSLLAWAASEPAARADVLAAA